MAQMTKAMKAATMFATGPAVPRVIVALAAGIVLVGCVGPGTAPVVHASTSAQPGVPAAATASAAEIRSPLGSYLAGRLAHRENDTAAAVLYLSRALAEDPTNLDLLRQTYLAMHAEGRMLESVALARRVVAINPESPIAGLVLVIDAMRSGRFDAAKKGLDALPLDGYNAILVPVLQAWIAVGQKRFDTAAGALDALEDRKDLAAFRNFHAALIADLAGNLVDAERGYRMTVAARPGGSYRAVSGLGSFLERHGRPEEARELYEGYLAENPDSLWFDYAFDRPAGDPAPQPIVRNELEGAAELLFGVASALHQQSAYSAALLYNRAALYLRPEFDTAQLLLGEIFEALGRSTDAIAAYRAIPPESPLHWSMQLRLAANLDEIGRTDEAIAGLRAMAASRVDREDPLLALGALLRGKERWTDAVAVYDEAIARIPELEQRHWRAFYARGIGLERSKQWQRSERDFLRALDLRPDQPFVLNYLGYSWVDQGVNLERALKMIERAVELRPNDGYIIDSLGWARYRLGEFEDGVIQLERAVELRPDDPTINDHLGDAYWQVGRRIEARFQWRRALALKPEEEETVVKIEAKLLNGLTPSAVADDGT